MNLGAIFVGVALTLASAIVIAEPFLKPRKPRIKSVDPVSSHPWGDDEEILLALRDLDFDFELGKLTKEDYETTRTGLMQEMAGVLKAQDKKERRMEAMIETQVRELRAGTPSRSYCHQCGSVVYLSDRDCSSCGTRINKSSGSSPSQD